MKKVGIIGGSGFIGSHITKTFLDKAYDVKVSTTNLSKKTKYQHLLELHNNEHLEIAELDITDKTTIKNFVSDCDIVVHSGTPFQLDVSDPQSELFDPTIKGTENFLEIICQTPTIEKVVFIASVAAYNTNFPLPPDNKSPEDILCETDKPFISDQSHPYAQAKFIANQTVEKFIKENPDLEFEITSVSPVAVMGKSLSNREDSTSTGLQMLFKQKIAPNPFIEMLYEQDAEFAMVDVSDVALGVYQAASNYGLHGKNYLLSSESYPVSDISLMLNNKPPKNNPKTIYQNSMAQKELNMKFKPAIVSLQSFNVN